MLSIAVPITLQNLISTGLNLVDNLMIGQLGTTAIASVGLVNQVVFILNILTFELCPAEPGYLSLSFGARETRRALRRPLDTCYI